MLKAFSIHSRAAIQAAGIGFIVAAGAFFLAVISVAAGFHPMSDFIPIGIGAAIGSYPVVADLIEERERSTQIAVTIKRISISPGVEPGEYDFKAEA
ncbi:MAG: hypothetical protein GC182_08945 [Rhodopseudomonas sp.]|nr:hypothetical protein [Rhodopseudomonas sp.]